MASGTIGNIKKSTISSTTTGNFGNVSLGVALDREVLTVYCEGYACIPRITSSAWTALVFKIDNNEFVLAKNTPITNVNVVYR